MLSALVAYEFIGCECENACRSNKLYAEAVDIGAYTNIERNAVAAVVVVDDVVVDDDDKNAENRPIIDTNRNFLLYGVLIILRYHRITCT